MRYTILVAAAILTIAIASINIAAQYAARDHAPRIAVPLGVTLETLSRMYPVSCYYFWYSNVYCIVDVYRTPERVTRAQIRLRKRRVYEVQYRTIEFRDGIGYHTSCRGY